MAELIRYLILANIFLVVLSLFFRLLLAKERWFRFNRTVLLGGVMLALIIPIFQLDLLAAPENALIVIPEMITAMPIMKVDVLLEEVMIYGTAPKVFPWVSLSQILYLAGIILTGILFTWRLRQIKQLQKSNSMKWVRDLFVTILPAGNSAFSFLGVVYFPCPLKENDPTDRMILEHERAHIYQRHSVDIIFIEVVKILFFYNPAVYSLKRQMELTHEYLADNAGAGTASDIKSYSLALFRAFFQSPGFSLSHGFKSPSTIKQRFIMLQKQTSSKYAGMRYFLLLPLALSFLILSAFTTVKANNKTENHSTLTKTEAFIPFSRPDVDVRDQYIWLHSNLNQD